MAMEQFWEGLRREAPKYRWALFPVEKPTRPGTTYRLRTLAPGAHGSLCPLMVLHFPVGAELSSTQVHALGLTDAEGMAIMDAADGVPGHDPVLRRDLIALVGVREVR